MTFSQYAQRFYNIFLLGLLVLIYNPFFGLVGKDHVDTWMRYTYLFLLLGFFISAAVYVITIVTESGEDWLRNIFRKPITYWNKDPTEAQVDAEQTADEQEMQPSSFIAFIAYPLMLFAFRDLAYSLLKKKGVQLYGSDTFYNPFQDEITSAGESMSANLISFLLTSLSSLAFVFNFGALPETVLPEKWKSTGSLIISSLTAIAGLAYTAFKLYRGDTVTPIGLVNPETNLRSYLMLFGIMLAATILIGYPINPLLTWVRERLGPDGYWISIISSIATTALARYI